MAIWLQYHASESVPCKLCGVDLGPASKHYVVGFPNGQGNCEKNCTVCRQKTYYDIAPSVIEAQAHRLAHSELLDEIRHCTIMAFAAERNPHFVALAKGLPKRSRHNFGYSEGVDTFDKLPIATRPITNQAGSAFDL